MQRVLAAPTAMLGGLEARFHLLLVAEGVVVDAVAARALELGQIVLRHRIKSKNERSKIKN